MDAIIIFIVRLFTAAFYTLIFYGLLGVVSFLIWITDDQDKKRGDKK